MLCYTSFILIFVSFLRCKGIFIRWQKYIVTDKTYGNCTAIQEQISQRQCIAACVITEGCKSVNVKKGNNLCELCSEYPMKSNQTVTLRPGWTIYYKKEPRNCNDLFKNGDRTSGFKVFNPTYPTETTNLRAYCLMDFQGGGWTVIQSRVSNSSFYRGWQEYRDGFGDDVNFWLGLQNIRLLTVLGVYELLIYMETANATAIAKYSNFYIGDESAKYKLTVVGYSYDASYVNPGDKFSMDSGMMFTTLDRDNDKWAPGSCAQSHSSAWWYSACYETDLNLPFGRMFWRDFSDKIVLSRMMIRPRF